MANDNVSPLSPHTQFAAANNLENREARQYSLHMAIIQQPLRKWEKAWRHQRVIVLFAKSPEETKLRLQLEDRMRHGEQVLRIIPVGE